MAIYCLGSINADYIYSVPHLPQPGETLAAIRFTTGLGGKGANQSVAAARAGAEMFHIGAVGGDGQWAIDELQGYGVDTRHIVTTDVPTGHAIINVDAAAENAIVIYSGANVAQDEASLRKVISSADDGDSLLLQNETSLAPMAAELGKARGMRVFYSAAPFDVDATKDVLPHVSVLVMNEVESSQLCAALDTDLKGIGVPHILVTKGAAGAEWHSFDAGETVRVDAFKVDPVDTTGAGDTFIGYVVAGLDSGLTVGDSMRRAAAASAIKVMREGAAPAIPSAAEVDEFLSRQ